MGRGDMRFSLQDFGYWLRSIGEWRGRVGTRIRRELFRLWHCWTRFTLRRHRHQFKSFRFLKSAYLSFLSIIGLPRSDLPTLLNPCRRYIATRACGEIPLSEGRDSSMAEANPCLRAALIAASMSWFATPRRRCCCWTLRFEMKALPEPAACISTEPATCRVPFSVAVIC